MSISSDSKKTRLKTRFLLFGAIGVIIVGFSIGIPLYLNAHQTESDYTDISVQEAKNMMDDNAVYPDLLVLDVRTQSEYDSGHIINATLIPIDNLETRLNEIEPHINIEIIVYCQSGSRSARASAILVENGFSKIYNMLGGYSAWVGAGF